MDEDALPVLRSVANILRCVRCRSPVEMCADSLRCSSASCGVQFPLIRSAAVFLPEGEPLLAVRNDVENRPTRWRKVRSAIRRRLPNIVLNVGGSKAITSFLKVLSQEVSNPMVLNIGEKHPGPVLDALDRADLVHIRADRAPGPGTQLVLHMQHLPFADDSIDAIVMDSGLEHVSDPPAVVREILRTLKPRGLVYVDQPFMMPVHAGAGDYQRFTSRGLCALFRDFEEIETGVSCGPAMALTQQFQYTLLSFVRRQWARVAVKLAVRFSLFWLKYLDLYLARKPGAMDAAGGTYFIGHKRGRRATDAEIERGYRGIVPSMYEPHSGITSLNGD